MVEHPSTKPTQSNATQVSWLICNGGIKGVWQQRHGNFDHTILSSPLSRLLMGILRNPRVFEGGRIIVHFTRQTAHNGTGRIIGWNGNIDVASRHEYVMKNSLKDAWVSSFHVCLLCCKILLIHARGRQSATPDRKSYDAAYRSQKRRDWESNCK